MMTRFFERWKMQNKKQSYFQSLVIYNSIGTSSRSEIQGHSIVSEVKMPHSITELLILQACQQTVNTVIWD